MKTKKQYFLSIFVLVPLTVTCCNDKNSIQEDLNLNNERIIYQNGVEEVLNVPTIIGDIKDGQVVDIVPKEWSNFINSPGDYSRIKDYYCVGTENCSPQFIEIKWTISDDCSSYDFYLSTNKNMSDASIIPSQKESITLNDLFAGQHYYYQIHAFYEDRTIISKRFDFATSNYFRLIDIQNVYNARDIGGKTTKDSLKRVKQGLVYRSANFDSVSSNGIYKALHTYGLKTELDLRETILDVSPLGEHVKYINNAVGEYGSPLYMGRYNGLATIEYQKTMANNLRVFSDINNYPMIFHCAVGRDRTGTLAIVLYLLLGINEKQIKDDWASSFFSLACNGEDFEAYSELAESIFKYLKVYSSNQDIYTGIEDYCLDIGLSKEEIDSIRENLLEPVI